MKDQRQNKKGEQKWKLIKYNILGFYFGLLFSRNFFNIVIFFSKAFRCSTLKVFKWEGTSIEKMTRGARTQKALFDMQLSHWNELVFCLGCKSKQKMDKIRNKLLNSILILLLIMFNPMDQIRWGRGNLLLAAFFRNFRFWNIYVL